MTALLKEVLEVLKEVELPPRWAFDSSDNWALTDGYIFLKKGKDSAACIVDYHNQRRAITTLGKGPISLEKYSKDKWELLCDADTPKQVVDAFLTYNTFGAFNDL